VARPRLHAPDAVLDAAEDLLVERGRASLTVRALATRAGASNGSIYHSFGSVEGVVAEAWLRRARQFLGLQRAAVDLAGSGRPAVLAAADAPARLAEVDPRAARLLTSLTRDDVLTDALDEPVAEALRALDGELAELLRCLTEGLWQRRDRAAVGVVTTCGVRLPAALIFPGNPAGAVPGQPPRAAGRGGRRRPGGRPALVRRWRWCPSRPARR
jgi:AcrR family transcriptional regulator